MRLTTIIACVLLGMMFAIVPCQADKRVALVIGNSNYRYHERLPNPINDAAAMATMFKAADFEVTEPRADLGLVEMNRVISNFRDAAQYSDIAVIYYAGHGIEIGGNNYLIPVDAALARDFDVEAETVPLDRVLRAIEPARRLRLVILDSCRNNPFVETMTRSLQANVGRGLARVEPTKDTLVAFAARAGSTAVDGTGEHSPFVAALLQHLKTPGLDVRLAFGRVRDTVLAATQQRQEPFIYGSLGGAEIALVPGQPPDSGQQAPLRIAGSTTVGDEFAPDLIAGYARKSPKWGSIEWAPALKERSLTMVGQDSRHNTVVTLSRRGTVDGFDQLDARLADIGMASSEWANFPERKLDGSIETGLENVIALDAVVPMVNTMNSVASVTIDQLRRIYLCEIVNWSQVGGEAGEIMAYGRDPRSGTYQVWRDLVMRGQEPGPCVKATRDSDEMQKKIKETGHSIGYAGFAFTRGNKPLDIITDCGPQRLTFRPDEDLVRTEEYPLSRRLYLYALRPYENSDTRDFIKYAMSSEAWRIAANDGFISLEPKLYPKSDEDPRTELMRRGLAGYGPLTTIDDLEMVDYLNSPVSDSNAQRITITFRFRPGSSELDSKAESDVSRLVDFLRKPEYASRRLYIAGFADATLMTDPNTPNDVKEKINIDLSRSRARTIADKLRAQNIRINPSDVKGFGRIAPVACNDDWIRRDKNRRVEVWLL